MNIATSKENEESQMQRFIQHTATALGCAFDLRRASIYFALVWALGYSVTGNAVVQCGAGISCDERTRRQVDAIVVTDGCGASWTFTDGNYAAAAQAMGPRYAACLNTLSPRTGTSSYGGQAEVSFPIPSDRLGQQNAIVNSSWLHHFVTWGGVVSDVPTTSLNMQGWCSDAKSVLGGDGACYCKTPYSWDAGKKACITVVDKGSPSQPLTCPAEPRTKAPLYPLSGKKTLTLDLGMGIGKEALALSYDTSRYLPTTGATFQINGSFGSHDRLPRALDGLWFTQLHKRINIQRPSSGAYPWSVRVLGATGQWITFMRTNATTYSALTPDTVETLVPEMNSGSTTNRLFYTDRNGNVETYDAYNIASSVVADLVRIDYAGGGHLVFSYTGGNITQVTDDVGRVLKLQYNAASKLSAMMASDGRSLAFTYDSNGMLAGVTWPDGMVRQFLHENVALPWAVTGIVDENASRLFSFTYDAQGRAVESQYANGAMRYAVSQNTPSTVNVSESWDEASKTLTRTYVISATDSAVLTSPNGEVAAITGTTIQGRVLATSQSQPAGTGCAASNSASDYDANGNMVRRDDFQGQRTCYAYDSANREVTRVEGLAALVACSAVTPAGATLPSGARKITTTWHPDWRLPEQINDSVRRTTTVYQGRPDPFNSNVVANCTSAPNLPNGKPRPVICKQVEQALLANGNVDTTITAKTRTYTYDASGRVLTSADENGRSTSYSYYGSAVFDSNAPGAYDLDYEKVMLLLHGNGSHGSTTIVDHSPSAKTATPLNDTKISTAQSLFGGSSIFFDGGSDFLQVPYSTDFSFGAGDFTIETWVYKIANNPNGSKIWSPNGDYYDGVVAQIDASGNLSVFLSTSAGTWSYYMLAVANLVNSQWHHIAITRSGGSVFAFVNGVRYTVTAALGTTALYSNANYARVIGGQGGVNRTLNGYIDDFRITKGIARYTTNFTLSTAEFPNQGLLPHPADVGHAIGDLQSITNAAGHVTQFTQYDRAGRVRQMIGPKGVVTDITYTPRGWVSTVSTTAPGAAARLTTYTYDGVGQLTGVAQPDGSTQSYSYDAAHRLVGVTDAKGNSVSYTLDNAGNKIAEEVKDPSGVLQRSIGRSFDALNRVQQVTGASK